MLSGQFYSQSSWEVPRKENKKKRMQGIGDDNDDDDDDVDDGVGDGDDDGDGDGDDGGHDKRSSNL